MNWVLIAIVTATNPSIVMMRYPNKVSCEASRLWIKTNSSVTSDNSVCLPDLGDEEEIPKISEPDKRK